MLSEFHLEQGQTYFQEVEFFSLLSIIPSLCDALHKILRHTLGHRHYSTEQGVPDLIELTLPL